MKSKPNVLESEPNVFESFQAGISNIPKNHEDETVYGILIKDSHFPILCVSEKC